MKGEEFIPGRLLQEFICIVCIPNVGLVGEFCEHVNIRDGEVKGDAVRSRHAVSMFFCNNGSRNCRAQLVGRLLNCRVIGGGHDLREVSERSEEHTSELQSLTNLVCRLLLEKKKKKK